MSEYAGKYRGKGKVALERAMAARAQTERDERDADALATVDVLKQVAVEREAQDAKWGTRQSHPDGTSEHRWSHMATMGRDLADARAKNGKLTWLDILTEEFYEVAEQEDVALLHNELVQVAAVCVNWIEDIERDARPPKDKVFGMFSADVEKLIKAKMEANMQAAIPHLDPRSFGSYPGTPPTAVLVHPKDLEAWNKLTRAEEKELLK